MTELDRQADLIRMTRWYLDRSYYPSPGREEYYSAFLMACDFLGISPDTSTALEAWERIRDRHLDPSSPGGRRAPGKEPGGGPDDPGPGGRR